jgi:hypothetical protein
MKLPAPNDPEGARGLARCALARRGRRRTIVGGLWFALGVGATFASLASAGPGERFTLFYGAIAWGGIELVQGLADWLPNRDALRTPPASRSAHRRTLALRRPWRGLGNTGHAALALSLCALVISTLAVSRPWLHSAYLRACERQAIEDLESFAKANAIVASLNGSFVAPEVLADPRRLPWDPSPLLSPRFSRPVRNGYRFVFEPGEQARSERALIYRPSYESYVYYAAPLWPGRTGIRTFAYYGRGKNVMSRSDGQRPTPQDAAVEMEP